MELFWYAILFTGTLMLWYRALKGLWDAHTRDRWNKKAHDIWKNAFPPADRPDL